MSLTPADLAALMAGATPHAVLDVRERAAYERGHIYWTTSLPRRLLETRLPGLVTAKRTPIALVDADGSVADLARSTLAAMGYTDVRPLAGGLAPWRAAGRPTVQGLNVPSKVFGERALHEWKTPQVSCPELAKRIANGDDMVIVDSRTPEEYHRGCIPGSVSMPGGELVLRIGELVKRPDQTIVVHCGGRTRSYIGAESLRRMGLPNPIIALENGTMGWLLAGLELERGAERWAPAPTAKGRAVAAEVARRVAQADGLRGITAAELKAMQSRRDQENLYVFDVRTTEEYAASHVPGAVWAPGGQAVQAIDDYLAVRGAQIVFVCDDGSRAALSTAWYKRLGFPRIAFLEGGCPPGRRRAAGSSPGTPRPCRGGSRPRARRPRRSRRRISGRPSCSASIRATCISRPTCRARPGCAGVGSSRRSARSRPTRARRWSSPAPTAPSPPSPPPRSAGSATRRPARSRAACGPGRPPGAPSRPGPRGSPTRSTTSC